MNNRRARLEDVAQLAKVSKMTVSLCLRPDGGKGRISPDTRERVMQAIETLSYRPNRIGRALRHGSTHIIAFYAGRGYVNVRIPYFTEIISGLQEGCETTQNDLLIHGAFRQLSQESVLSELLNGLVDGLVVDTTHDDPLIPWIAKEKFAAVAVCYGLASVPSVVVDEKQAADLLAEHLLGLGHRKIAYGINIREPEGPQIRRLRFEQLVNDAGGHVDVIGPTTDFSADELGSAALRAGATALVCWNDSFAYDAIQGLRRNGLEAPKDLAVTGFDGCPMSLPVSVNLTTIRAPWSEVAKLALTNLYERIQGNPIPEQVVLPVEFVKGETT